MTPVLYILMRTDLASLNSGKAMAQASHASNAFLKMAEGDIYDARAEATKKWTQETAQGFGTVLVLGATLADINEVVEAARLNNFIAGKVTDPTYPYRVESGEVARLIPTSVDTLPRPAIIDGKTPVTLYREEVTCAFVFGYKEELEAMAIGTHLKLHP